MTATSLNKQSDTLKGNKRLVNQKHTHAHTHTLVHCLFYLSILRWLSCNAIGIHLFSTIRILNFTAALSSCRCCQHSHTPEIKTPRLIIGLCPSLSIHFSNISGENCLKYDGHGDSIHASCCALTRSKWRSRDLCKTVAGHLTFIISPNPVWEKKD